jgi:hypothetical protein
MYLTTTINTITPQTFKARLVDATEPRPLPDSTIVLSGQPAYVALYVEDTTGCGVRLCFTPAEVTSLMAVLSGIDADCHMRGLS